MIENGNITSYIVRYLIEDTITAINPVTKEEELKIVKNEDLFVKMQYASGKANSLALHDFFGKSSKELASLKLDYYPRFKKDSTVTTFQYTYDKLSRVSTLIKTAKSTDPPEYNNDAQEADTCHFTYY